MKKNSVDELLAQATCAVIIEGHVAGTAWLLSDEGYLLTAGHLLCQDDDGCDEGHEQVEVRFSGDEVSYPAHQVACGFELAQEVDFAVLKLAQMPRNRQPLPFSLARSVTGTFRLHGYGKSLAECAPCIAPTSLETH